MLWFYLCFSLFGIAVVCLFPKIKANDLYQIKEPPESDFVTKYIDLDIRLSIILFVYFQYV